jgi:arabinose-5-phosphate isomerase
MVISEMMRTGDAHCVLHFATITRQGLHAITGTKGRPGAAAIVDDNGKLMGIFTDGNLRRYLEQDTSFLDKPIGEICSKDPLTVRPTQLAQEASRIIQERKVDQLIVVDESNVPVGLIDIQDLLAHGMIRPGPSV